MHIKSSIIVAVALAPLALPAAALAQPAIAVTLGVRETNTGAPIGGNGGTTGGIEWVNPDGQVLFVDGTWQQFTWNPALDFLDGFAGTTADNILDGDDGTIEHLRFKALDPDYGPFDVWIDDITVSTTTLGSVEITGFEGFDQGAEVMFQEPTFSGSTAHFLIDPALFNVAGIDNNVARTGVGSYYTRWGWVVDPFAWMRLTTHPTIQPLASPTVPFTDNAEVSIWMRAEIADPPPPPCACETTGDTVIDVFDLLAYLDLWFIADAGADIDGTAGVDVFDLLVFLDCWFVGCP